MFSLLLKDQNFSLLFLITAAGCCAVWRVTCEKVKFADDDTIGISGDNPLELAQSMKKDLQYFPLAPFARFIGALMKLK